MPACSPGHLRPISSTAPASFPQRSENTGLKSLKVRWSTITGGVGLRTSGAPEAASFAGRDVAMVWRRRYLDWMESGLPHAGTDLFARLPFHDAVTLAALVGTGRMTWPEVNVALGAMLKLAAADALDGRCAKHSPPSPKRVVEDKIWARYHAQCDEVFSGSIGPTNTCPSERLWRTERILDRLRSARDRELAAVRRRLHVQSSAPAASEIRLKQSQEAWTELSPAERAALDKLDATGFIASAGMIATIDDLVGEIGGTLGGGA